MIPNSAKINRTQKFPVLQYVGSIYNQVSFIQAKKIHVDPVQLQPKIWNVSLNSSYLNLQKHLAMMQTYFSTFSVTLNLDLSE